MPYQVQQIIAGKGPPVCVSKDDLLSRALALMIEHDFGQLPVIRKVRDPVERDIPEGMITYEGIVRSMRNFGAKLDDLSVRDVMVVAPLYSLEDDLFDILDRLKASNAVLVIAEFGAGPSLVGIVTTYDATEYFRNRTEDLMRVEDIEIMVKDFIRAAYVDERGELDADRLNAAIIRIAPHKNKKGGWQKERSFDDLTLSEYSTLLALKETWPFFAPIFGVKRSAIIELLNGVREIRNALAHFRGSFSTEQRDKLKFAAQWLSRCQEAHLAHKPLEETARLIELFEQHVLAPASKTVREEFQLYDLNAAAEYAVDESAKRGGRYAALADWLQSRPGRVDQVQLSLAQIEKIIQTELPASARIQRAWWANGTGYGHAQLWREAGWRANSIDLVEGRLTFSRIR